jgi:hypothetical protein
MAEPQLSVRSAKARDLAHRLARREQRSIADIVERALECYEVREAGREPAAASTLGSAASSARTSSYRPSSPAPMRGMPGRICDLRRYQRPLRKLRDFETTGLKLISPWDF